MELCFNIASEGVGGGGGSVDNNNEMPTFLV